MNHRLTLAAALLLASTSGALAKQTNNILLTGYWPPTNEMLRQFSPDPSLNGGLWVGENWEGRGFNVYAYFPTFPPGGPTTSAPWGSGDFEVDYQDTSADWERIVAELRPAAIITNSRANTSVGWEMEPGYQRFRLPGESSPPGRSVSQYSSDRRDVLYPSNVAAAGLPVGTVFPSTLPQQQIVDNIAATMSPVQIDPFIQSWDPTGANNYGGFDFGGNYLSGFIGLLGAWYHHENNTTQAAFRNYSAGHIHVGRFMDTAVAAQATEITLRTVIDHIEPLMYRPGDANADGFVNLLDFNLLAANFGTSGTTWGEADFNYDGVVNLLDFNLLATNFGMTPEQRDQYAAMLVASIPEPASAALVAVPALALRRRRC